MSASSHGAAIAAPRAAGARVQHRRHERRPVVVAFVAALAAAVPTASGGGIVAGSAGVAGALVGTGLVLVLFAAGAAAMMWAGRRGASAMTLAAGLGVAARLMLYAVVLLGLDGADIVHRPSLAAAAAVTLVITLAGEMAVLARTPSLYRLQVPPAARGAAPLERAPSAAPPRPNRRGPTTTPDPAEPTSPGHPRAVARTGPFGPSPTSDRSTTQ